MDRTPDFLTQAHDERDPSPWLALYLDQSTPLPDEVKAAWLADSSSGSRQYLLPFLRPIARATIILIQVVKVSSRATGRTRGCCTASWPGGSSISCRPRPTG